jgi:hypothetical protein
MAQKVPTLVLATVAGSLIFEGCGAGSKRRRPLPDEDAGDASPVGEGASGGTPSTGGTGGSPSTGGTGGAEPADASAPDVSVPLLDAAVEASVPIDASRDATLDGGGGCFVSPGDTTPPQVLGAEFIAPRTIRLTFSEPVVPQAEVDPSQFRLSVSSYYYWNAETKYSSLESYSYYFPPLDGGASRDFHVTDISGYCTTELDLTVANGIDREGLCSLLNGYIGNYVDDFALRIHFHVDRGGAIPDPAGNELEPFGPSWARGYRPSPGADGGTGIPDGGPPAELPSSDYVPGYFPDSPVEVAVDCQAPDGGWPQPG